MSYNIINDLNTKAKKSRSLTQEHHFILSDDRFIYLKKNIMTIKTT